MIWLETVCVTVLLCWSIYCISGVVVIFLFLLGFEDYMVLSGLSDSDDPMPHETHSKQTNFKNAWSSL